MSIKQDELFNLYSINKIIKKDGTIDLTDLELLSSLNNFIKSHTFIQNNSLKLNDEDLLELININKNNIDTRNFLDKFDINDTTNCSSNIELIIDDSNQTISIEPDPEPEVETDFSEAIEPDPEPDVETDYNVNLNKKTRKQSKSKAKKPSKKSKKTKS
jgi:hypothetical protein